jgi:hypothetical protein
MELGDDPIADAEIPKKSLDLTCADKVLYIPREARPQLHAGAAGQAERAARIGRAGGALPHR